MCVLCERETQRETALCKFRPSQVPFSFNNSPRIFKYPDVLIPKPSVSEENHSEFYMNCRAVIDSIFGECTVSFKSESLFSSELTEEKPPSTRLIQVFSQLVSSYNLNRSQLLFRPETRACSNLDRGMWYNSHTRFRGANDHPAGVRRHDAASC